MKLRWLTAALVFSACDAQPPGGSPTEDAGTGGTIVGDGPYCEVQRAVFDPYCTICHQPGGQQPIPDLSFDGAKTSLAGVESAMFPGHTFVVAGNSAQSFIYKKVTGDLQANEGAVSYTHLTLPTILRV